VHFCSRRETLCRILGHGFENEGRERLRYVGVEHARARRILFDVFGYECPRRVSQIRHAPGETFEQHDPHSVEIAARIELHAG
jgi:hypothetical protein